MRVKVNFENIRQNISVIREQLGVKPKLCAVVKANAYGHGLVEVAQYVERDVDYFAVARLDEALLLRGVGIEKQVLVLNPLLTPSDIQIAGKNGITLTSDGLNNLERFAEAKAKIHIKVDSGMNRLGLKNLIETEKVLLESKRLGVSVDGLYSHFAATINTNPQKMFEQYELFREFTDLVKNYFPDAVCHICNTSGTLCCPAFHGDMVRVGIGLYGYSDRKSLTLRKCKTVTAKVVETKNVNKEQTVGYDCKFKADKKTEIAVIDCGYGDGLPRQFGNGGQVLTQFGKMPVIGNICMDLTMIENLGKKLKVGDDVIILGEYGKNSVKADEIAKICGTISYEILCNLRNR